MFVLRPHPTVNILSASTYHSHFAALTCRRLFASDLIIQNQQQCQAQYVGYNKFFKLPTALDIVLVNVPLPREPTCAHQNTPPGYDLLLAFKLLFRFLLRNYDVLVLTQFGSSVHA